VAEYKKILIAVDLTEQSEHVVSRGVALARLTGADVRLLHIVEYVPVEPMGEALLPAVDIEDELLEGARKRLDELAARLDISDLERSVESGNIKSEMIRIASDWSADLIVLGSRERHGLAVMLNLAEDTILHAAPCDVLAVRVSD
jgi:universal stress protein A